jgi:hypothetical protein
VTRWVQEFLGLGSELVTAIPVGDAAELSADGRFNLTVPDLSHERAGELQFWARERGRQAMVAQLAPAGPRSMTTRMGDWDPLPFEPAFVACAANAPQVHDREGFARRTDVYDACDR